MQITIKQDELELAVRAFVETMGISVPVGDIKFIASRTDGVVTEVTLKGLSETAPTPTKVVPIAKPAPEQEAPVEATVAETAVVEETPELVEEEEEVVDLPEGTSLFG